MTSALRSWSAGSSSRRSSRGCWCSWSRGWFRLSRRKEERKRERERERERGSRDLRPREKSRKQRDGEKARKREDRRIAYRRDLTTKKEEIKHTREQRALRTGRTGERAVPFIWAPLPAIALSAPRRTPTSSARPLLSQVAPWLPWRIRGREDVPVIR